MCERDFTCLQKVVLLQNLPHFRYRGLGSARFTLGTLVRIASLRSYKGRLSYLPPSILTSSPDATPPPPRRPLSRSITEGLEGFCRTPIHRTCSDMGISEQRSLRWGEGEREKEERQRERERRRERARGGGTGVVRASSLAEDREREGEVEMEAEEERSGTCSERSGTSSESNERDECSIGRTQALAGIKDKGGMGHDSSEMEEDDQGKDGSTERGLYARELGEGSEVDMGREADEEPDGGFTYQDRLQEVRQTLRKNSAPSSQIANSLLSQPLSQVPDTDSGTSYGVDDMDLNGTYYQMDVARERALTISSPFRHSPLSYKPKTLDQNQNASRPRPLSLLQHSHTNSLPPKFPSLSLSLSPTPPSSPSCASPHSSSYLVPRPNTPNSTSPSPSLRTPSSSFNFDIAEPAGPQKNRPFVLPLNLPKDDLLPPLDQPLPTRDWITIEGDFVLVLALYQSHLGADLYAAPQARFDDGLIHLTFVRAGISRATLLRLFFAMERGTHHSVSSPYVSHVTCKAFRLQPLSTRGTLTVDGELVPYGPLQAQVRKKIITVILRRNFLLLVFKLCSLEIYF